MALEAGAARQEQITAVISKVPAAAMGLLCVGCYWISLRYFNSLKVIFSASIAILIPFLLIRTSVLSRFLGSSTMGWVGKRTYAMYLFHRVSSNFAEHYLIRPTSNIRYVGVTFVAYLLVVVIAQAVYVTVEQPMIRFGRMLAKRIP